MKVAGDSVMKSATLGILAFLITGCNVEEPRGFVAREWSRVMREYQITPTFPPREDVQVGDLYLEPIVKDNSFDQNDFLPISLLVHRTDVGQKLSKYYANTSFSFPKTHDGNLAQADRPITPQAMAPGDVFQRKGDVNRLRLVGFPNFMSITLNRGDLAAVLPLPWVQLALGSSSSRVRSVRVSIPTGESYGFPAGDLLQAFELADHRSDLIIPGQAYRLICEVFLARAIDIEISTLEDSEFAAGVAPRGSTPPPIPWFNSEGTIIDPNKPVEANYEMSRRVEAALNQKTPGVSFSNVGTSATGVSIRANFERPVAVGYRYIPLRQVSSGKYKVELSRLGGPETLIPTTDDKVDP